MTHLTAITWCLLCGSVIITIYPENQTIHHKQSGDFSYCHIVRGHIQEKRGHREREEKEGDKYVGWVHD